MRSWVVAGAVMALGACGPKVATDEETGADSTSAASSDSNAEVTTANPGTGPGSADTGGPVSDVTSAGEVGEVGVVTGFFPDWGTVGQACDILPEFTCSTGVDCSQVSCGDPFSPFDAEGCLRPSCPCADGEVCFAPIDWGGCASSELFCEDVPGQGCLCGGTDDCGGSYCLPAEQVPALPCLGIEDPESCEASNCTWLWGDSVLGGMVCGCNPMHGVCVEPLDYALAPGPAIYHRIDDPTQAVILYEDVIPTPPGLVSCESPDAPEVCECASGCL